MHTDGQVLGHLARLNGLNHSRLQGSAPLGQGIIAVQLGPAAEQGFVGQPGAPLPNKKSSLQCSLCMQLPYCQCTRSLVSVNAEDGRTYSQHINALTVTSGCCKCYGTSFSFSIESATVFLQDPPDSPVCQATSPCKDAGHWVGAGGVALLVLTPVTSHSACINIPQGMGRITE